VSVVSEYVFEAAYFYSTINNIFSWRKLKAGTQDPINPLDRCCLLLVSSAVPVICHVSSYISHIYC
jgi:hypothetical protein